MQSLLAVVRIALPIKQSMGVECPGWRKEGRLFDSPRSAAQLPAMLVLEVLVSILMWGGCVPHITRQRSGHQLGVLTTQLNSALPTKREHQILQAKASVLQEPPPPICALDVSLSPAWVGTCAPD